MNKSEYEKGGVRFPDNLPKEQVSITIQDFEKRMLDFAERIGKGERNNGEFHVTTMIVTNLSPFGVAVYDDAGYWITIIMNLTTGKTEAMIYKKGDFFLDAYNPAESQEAIAAYRVWCEFVLSRHIKNKYGYEVTPTFMSESLEVLEPVGEA